MKWSATGKGEPGPNTARESGKNPHGDCLVRRPAGPIRRMAVPPVGNEFPSADHRVSAAEGRPIHIERANGRAACEGVGRPPACLETWERGCRVNQRTCAKRTAPPNGSHARSSGLQRAARRTRRRAGCRSSGRARGARTRRSPGKTGAGSELCAGLCLAPLLSGVRCQLMLWASSSIYWSDRPARRWEGELRPQRQRIRVPQLRARSRSSIWTPSRNPEPAPSSAHPAAWRCRPCRAEG